MASTNGLQVLRYLVQYIYCALSQLNEQKIRYFIFGFLWYFMNLFVGSIGVCAYVNTATIIIITRMKVRLHNAAFYVHQQNVGTTVMI